MHGIRPQSFALASSKSFIVLWWRQTQFIVQKRKPSPKILWHLYVHVADIKCQVIAILFQFFRLKQQAVTQSRWRYFETMLCIGFWFMKVLVLSFFCTVHLELFNPKKTVQRPLADAMSRVVVQFSGTKSWLPTWTCFMPWLHTQDWVLPRYSPVKMYQNVKLYLVMIYILLWSSQSLYATMPLCLAMSWGVSTRYGQGGSRMVSHTEAHGFHRPSMHFEQGRDVQ